MDFFDVIDSRRSIRSYKNIAVEDDKLRAIFDAVRLAPSARHRQPWRFIVVTDPEIKGKVYKASRDQRFILEAPVVNQVHHASEHAFVVSEHSPAPNLFP